MDEKTEQLRDIFLEVSEDGTVTERQAANRGSLSADDSDVAERVAAVIAEMRDRYEFTTGLNDGTLVLVREHDTDAPFDLGDLRALLEEDASVADAAAELGVSESTVRRYRHVVAAQDAARGVSERFRSEFEDAVGEIGDRMTADAKEDGLEDATDGMETNVSF